MSDNIGTENSLVVGAEKAYEEAVKEAYPDWVLELVCNQIGNALHWAWARGQPLNPTMEAARAEIEECAQDFPDELLAAALAAFTGNCLAGRNIMRNFIRTYAEAHLTELVKYFQIDVGRGE